jgi:hypothetical protein
VTRVGLKLRHSKELDDIVLASVHDRNTRDASSLSKMYSRVTRVHDMGAYRHVWEFANLTTQAGSCVHKFQICAHNLNGRRGRYAQPEVIARGQPSQFPRGRRVAATRLPAASPGRPSQLAAEIRLDRR